VSTAVVKPRRYHDAAVLNSCFEYNALIACVAGKDPYLCFTDCCFVSFLWGLKQQLWINIAKVDTGSLHGAHGGRLAKEARN
jgi:hypothetical protein